MTRNQIPGIISWYGDEFFPEASWGLGWSVKEGKKCRGYGEPLQSPKAFCHSGAGGVTLSVDPGYELIVGFFSVTSYGGIPVHVTVQKRFVGDVEFMGRVDLFINAVTAAVTEV